MKFSLLYTILIFIFTQLASSYAQESVHKPDQNIVANDNIAYMAIDYNDGEVLLSHQADTKMYPASLTKMMTLYILFDKIKNQEISFDTQITISATAARKPPSKLGLPQGSKIKIADAIIAMVIKSSNDITYAVAEHLGKSERNFVKMMNNKAKELGLKSTRFVNSTGLHSNDQYSTPRDMMKLAKALMIYHNGFYSIFSISSFTWNNNSFDNTNTLLDYEGIDGIKTGYTKKSGYNLVSSASRGNSRLIAVVMGYQSSEIRNEEVIKIVQYGFDILDTKMQSNVHDLKKPKTINVSSEETDNDTPIYDITVINKLIKTADVTSYPTLEPNLHDNIAVNKVPYIEQITKNDSIKIFPTMGKTILKTKKSTAKGKYSLQVGAFRTYKSALRAGYNVAAISSLSSILSKNQLTVKKRSRYYVAKFENLNKNEAYNACSLLKKRKKDCLVLTS